MKFALALAVVVASFTASPGSAFVLVLPAIKEASDDPPAKAVAPEYRATQINQCPDTRGRMVLQDAPCFPAPAAAPESAAESMHDLASLEPRPTLDAVAPTSLPDSEGLTGWLRNAWWKLGLLCACAWGLLRVWRAVRANYSFRQYAEDRPDPPVTRR